MATRASARETDAEERVAWWASEPDVDSILRRRTDKGVAMSTEENFELVRRFNQAFGAEDLGVLDEILAVDFVAHNGDEEVHGPDGWRGFILEARAHGTEIETGNDELIGDGDLVAERWWWRAPADGGGQLNGHGITMHRIVNNRLQENWGVFHPDV
jgi:hypothetical protein